MEIVIEQAKVIYPGDPLHNKTVNIKIHNGIIESISHKKIKNSQTIKSRNLHISPGWIDVGTHCNEPGNEHRETITQLSKAATAGGYTTLIIFPNTDPVIQSKSEIEFILQKSRALPIQIIPIGALSKKIQGKELAEMIDMQHHGAIAFSDGIHSVQDTGVLLRAMLYARHFDGLLINQPEEESLSALGQMHEGIVSQRLGLKGIPEIAETIMLRRDLDLAAYANVRFLTHLISTEEGLQVIKKAKKNNTHIASSVAYLNLLLTDESLEGFESVYKQSPPIRSASHKKSLLKAIRDNTIDIICSNHRPYEAEKKDLEFAYATPGALGLQTTYAAINTYSDLTAEEWVLATAINPAKIFRLPPVPLKRGSVANLTLFDPSIEWTFGEDNILSESKNSPFIGHRLKGKVVGTIAKNQIILN